MRERALGIPGKRLEAVQRPCAGMWEVQGCAWQCGWSGVLQEDEGRSRVGGRSPSL